MTTKGTWKPANKKPPMLGNGFRRQLGVVVPVAAAAGSVLWPAVARWVLPWLAVSGGVALTSFVSAKTFSNIPINKGNIALASALTGAGTVAYFASQGLSEQHKPWAYAVAVAGVASGLFFLFKDPPPALPAETTGGGNIQPMIPVNQQMPKDPPGWLAQKLILKLDPGQDKTGGTVRNMGVNQPYAFAIRNQDPYKTAKFYAGLEIRDSDGKLLFKSQPDVSIFSSKLIEIEPNGMHTYELLSPSQWFWMSQTVTVGVNLYRDRDAQTPFMESNNMPIKMVYPGGGWLEPVGSTDRVDWLP